MVLQVAQSGTSGAEHLAACCLEAKLKGMKHMTLDTSMSD